MYKLLVTLQVLDFQALDEFERRASKVMADYQGKIICVFETKRNENGSGEEFHIVEFPNKDDFDSYRNDPRLQELHRLREKAISGAEIQIVTKEKSYS